MNNCMGTRLGPHGSQKGRTHEHQVDHLCSRRVSFDVYDVSEALDGTVVYVVDTEEKRQTDAVRVPGAAVVGSYGEVVKAIFNTEEDK